MKTRHLTALVLPLLITACASTDRQPASTPTHTPKVTEASATNALTALFKAHTKTLDRDLVTFHYGANAKRPSPTSLAEMNTRFKTMAAGFANPARTDESIVGAGFYVTIDPISTRDFGETSPELSVAKLKKGSHILDGAYAFDDAEKAKIDATIQTLQCFGTPDYGASTIGTMVGAFRNNGKTTNACIRAITTAIKNAGVQAIIYSYRGSLLPQCRFRFESFNVVDGAAVEALALYADSSKISGGEALDASVATLYAEVSGPNADPASRPPRQLPSPQPANAAYEAWKQATNFNCGPEWSIEVPTHGKAWIYDSTPKPLEILTKRLQAALKKKGATLNVLNDILAVWKLAYAAAPATKIEFKKWLTAASSLDSYALDYHQAGPGEIDNATQILGEPTPLTLEESLDEQVLTAETAAQGVLDANAFSATLAKHNYGPQTTKILATSLALHRLEAPYGVDAQALEATLKPCLAEYQDPAKSLKDIMAGDCSTELSSFEE